MLHMDGRLGQSSRRERRPPSMSPEVAALVVGAVVLLALVL